MIFTLVLVGFFGTFVFLYAQESIRLFHKLTAIPGVNLFAPLIFASCLIEIYEDEASSCLLYLHNQLFNFVQVLADSLPFEKGALLIVRIAFLFIMACLPTLHAWIKIKRRGLYELPLSAYYFGAVLWIIAVFLLIIEPT